MAILESYALILANIQALGGVRTDEAKYLLNIPYPHPPLGRWLFHALEWLPFQEMFWRIVLASFLVQALWLVWDLAHDLPLQGRYSVGGAWLLSSAVMLQGGTIMMAPLIALQILVILWLGSYPKFVKKYPGLIGLIWLASLFTALQAVLFFPLVWGILKRSKVTFRDCVLYVLIPMALLALYLLSNPFTLASVFIHSARGAGESLARHALGYLRVWALAGGGVISLVGTYGLFRSGRWDLILSFLLLSAYVLLSRYDYYAILFLPLFVAGVYELFVRLEHHHFTIVPFLSVFVIPSLIAFLLVMPTRIPGPARAVVQGIHAKGHTGSLMIVGSFGHDWQYESSAPVLKYSALVSIPKDAVIVCLDTCERGITQGRKFLQVDQVEVYLPSI